MEIVIKSGDKEYLNYPLSQFSNDLAVKLKDRPTTFSFWGSEKQTYWYYQQIEALVNAFKAKTVLLPPGVS